MREEEERRDCAGDGRGREKRRGVMGEQKIIEGRRKLPNAMCDHAMKYNLNSFCSCEVYIGTEGLF